MNLPTASWREESQIFGEDEGRVAMIRKLRLSLLDYIGLICILLGVLAIVIPNLMDIDQLSPSVREKILFGYSLAGFGVGAVAVGIGFWGLSSANKATEIAREANARMRAMAGLEFDEKMAVLESHIQHIRTNKKPLSDQIYHDVRACVRLQDWLEKEDMETLQAKVQRIQEAMKEYKGTHIGETNRYEWLLSKIETLEPLAKFL